MIKQVHIKVFSPEGRVYHHHFRAEHGREWRPEAIPVFALQFMQALDQRFAPECFRLVRIARNQFNVLPRALGNA